MNQSEIKWLPAHPNRYKSLEGLAARPWSLIVLHDMEAPESNKTAENVANWFHSEAEPQTSAHYCVDAESVIQCVQLRDVAFGAPGANRNGIHIELAGFAAQSLGQWDDEFSRQMLHRAADLITTIIAPKAHIPLEFVDVAGLKAGKRGITMHRTVSAAFTPGGHQDPGPNFPIDGFIELCRSLKGGAQ